MMVKKSFSRVYDREKVWTNYISLTCLEKLVEEISRDRNYSVQQNGRGSYQQELDWDISAENQTYHLKKRTRSKGDDNKYYPTVDDKWFSFELVKEVLTTESMKCLQLELHTSFWSNHDGSMDGVDSFRVEGSLVEDDPFATLIYERIIKNYDEFEQRRAQDRIEKVK